jgi:hypothetical protein
VCRWIETAVPAAYLALAAAALVGGYLRHRVARLEHRHYSRLPLDAGPEADRPVERSRRIAVAKWVVSCMLALAHLWALLDRMENGSGAGWRLVKPAAWLLGWVTASMLLLLQSCINHATRVCI